MRLAEALVFPQLCTGRTAMALRMLEDVLAPLTDALGMAYAKGHDAAVLACCIKAKHRSGLVGIGWRTSSIGPSWRTPRT